MTSAFSRPPHPVPPRPLPRKGRVTWGPCLAFSALRRRPGPCGVEGSRVQVQPALEGNLICFDGSRSISFLVGRWNPPRSTPPTVFYTKAIAPNPAESRCLWSVEEADGRGWGKELRMVCSRLGQGCTHAPPPDGCSHHQLSPWLPPSLENGSQSMEILG